MNRRTFLSMLGVGAAMPVAAVASSIERSAVPEPVPAVPPLIVATVPDRMSERERREILHTLEALGHQHAVVVDESVCIESMPPGHVEHMTASESLDAMGRLSFAEPDFTDWLPEDER